MQGRNIASNIASKDWQYRAVLQPKKYSAVNNEFCNVGQISITIIILDSDSLNCVMLLPVHVLISRASFHTEGEARCIGECNQTREK